MERLWLAFYLFGHLDNPEGRMWFRRSWYIAGVIVEFRRDIQNLMREYRLACWNEDGWLVISRRGD